MSIFSNWGKNKETNENKQAEIESINRSYTKRDEFEKSLKVDLVNESENIEKKSL